MSINYEKQDANSPYQVVGNHIIYKKEQEIIEKFTICLMIDENKKQATVMKTGDYRHMNALIYVTQTQLYKQISENNHRMIFMHLENIVGQNIPKQLLIYDYIMSHSVSSLIFALAKAYESNDSEQLLQITDAILSIEKDGIEKF